MLADQCSLYSLSAQCRRSCGDAIVSSIHTTNPSPNAPAQQVIVPRVVRRYAPPPPMAVRLAADLRPSADGSAVSTWLSCRQPACRKPRAAAHLGSCAKGQKHGRISQCRPTAHYQVLHQLQNTAFPVCINVEFSNVYQIYLVICLFIYLLIN